MSMSCAECGKTGFLTMSGLTTGEIVWGCSLACIKASIRRLQQIRMATTLRVGDAVQFSEAEYRSPAKEEGR